MKADFLLPSKGVPWTACIQCLRAPWPPVRLNGVPPWVGVVLFPYRHRLPVSTQRDQGTSCAWNSALCTRWLLTGLFMLSPWGACGMTWWLEQGPFGV